jgi:hypothetical protein
VRQVLDQSANRKGTDAPFTISVHVPAVQQHQNNPSKNDTPHIQVQNLPVSNTSVITSTQHQQFIGTTFTSSEPHTSSLHLNSHTGTFKIKSSEKLHSIRLGKSRQQVGINQSINQSIIIMLANMLGPRTGNFRRTEEKKGKTGSEGKSKESPSCTCSRRRRGRLCTLLTTLASGTVKRKKVSKHVKVDRAKGVGIKLTESPQKEPFWFVNSVKPAQGLSLISCMTPCRRCVTCWKASTRPS